MNEADQPLPRWLRALFILNVYAWLPVAVVLALAETIRRVKLTE